MCFVKPSTAPYVSVILKHLAATISSPRVNYSLEVKMLAAMWNSTTTLNKRAHPVPASNGTKRCEEQHYHNAYTVAESVQPIELPIKCSNFLLLFLEDLSIDSTNLNRVFKSIECMWVLFLPCMIMNHSKERTCQARYGATTNTDDTLRRMITRFQFSNSCYIKRNNSWRNEREQRTLSVSMKLRFYASHRSKPPVPFRTQWSPGSPETVLRTVVFSESTLFDRIKQS